jgi:phenylacetate-CoA ligase
MLENMRPFSARETLRNLVYISENFFPFSRRIHTSRDKIQAYQLWQIQRLIRHAYINVPLYREKYQNAGIRPEDIRSFKDFENIPLVTKEEVIASYPEKAMAKGTDIRRCLVSKSSGSSGKTINVIHRGDACGILGMILHRMFSLGFKYRPWHKMVYVYTSKFPAKSVFGMYRMYFIPTLNEIGNTLSRIERIKPDLIMCYPSHLKELGECLRSTGIRNIHPKAIWVGSEMSTQKERDYLGNLFGCPVYDEYSTEELTLIASQCRQKRYHLFEDICYTEIIGSDGQSVGSNTNGEVVGTYLHNYAMPFIRYRQGDYARLSDEECPCGLTFRTLDNIIGRKNDNFVLPSGRILSSGFLLDAAYSLLLELKVDIVDFCMIQLRRDCILLELLPGKEFSQESIGKINYHILSLIGEPVTIEVKTVETLYKTLAGKMNPIISNIGKVTDPY